MAKLVHLPNGEQASFPDDMDNSQIEYVLQKQFPSNPESKQKSLFDFDKKQAEEEFAKTSGEALRESPYVAQGAINEPGKMANVLLPKSWQVPKLNVANKLSPNVSPQDVKEAESLGGMMAMGLPRAGLMGSLKAAQGIPHIGKVLEQAMKASPILNKLFDIGGRGAEFGLYEASEHPENAATSGALGFGLGAGLSGLGHGVPAVANRLGFGKQPGQEAIEGLTYDQVAPSVEAAERLGTPLRPSEASRNPFLAGLEGKYPRTREAAFKNTEMGIERIGNEKKAINRFLDEVYSPSVANDEKINRLYRQVNQWNLKPSVVNKLKEDPIISDAFKEVASDSAWKRGLGDISENNYAYLDKVKNAIYNKESSLNAAGESTKARQYTQARHDLVSLMDESVPIYKEARELAERKITRENIIEELKKNEIEIKGSEFFKKFIKNENKFEDLMYSMRNVPEAQKMFQDMKSAWHSLINVEKPSTASYQSEKALNQARGSLNKAIEIWNQLTGKKKNLEAVKYIRGNQWVEDLKKAKSTGNKQKIENTVNDIMMKILPVGDFVMEGNK